LEDSYEIAWSIKDSLRVKIEEIGENFSTKQPWIIEEN
jgi:hypothetical protein